MINKPLYSINIIIEVVVLILRRISLIMKEYKLTIHENGVTKYYYVDALNEQDALDKGWELCDADDIYVSEVED